MSTLYQDWLDAKAREQEAVAQRRELEDIMRIGLSLGVNKEGTETFNVDGFVIKITNRMDRKVDGEKLQEIARENGLSDHLSSLFRWKPEVNVSAWKAADSSITGPLTDAITSKMGRPSFNIVRKEV